ncbi:MAG: sigma-70 family RNA polymerase sigma factor [Isosphaeraceae bacterium]
MHEDATATDDLIRRAQAGDESALAELFDRHRARLRQMIRMRLDRRLQGRVDPSDVLQDAFIDLSRKLPEYSGRDSLPFFIWLRLVVGERLLRVHRQHLGTAMRDAHREISLGPRAMPEASSASLAAQLLGQFTTASRVVARAEMQALLLETLNGLDPIDREVIALRHFEELSNDEVAAAMNLTKAAASKRYIRALLKLRRIVGEVPGLADGMQSGS